MADQPTSSSEHSLLSTQRELAWAKLDKRPEQSEIISYDPDEVAEVRRLTESELKLISRRSGTGSALNKETKAFLDAASVVRALSHVAEDRLSQGNLDAASTTVINAIRWQRLADGLYMSGGVTLPRINSVRLWYLLAEIYVRMDERDLALKTMQKAAASVGEFGNPSLSELLSRPDEPGQPLVERPERSSGYLFFEKKLAPLRTRQAALALGIFILVILGFTAFRAQVTVKSMIDNSSVGVDYLNIAFGPAGESQQDRTLLLAGQEFARLQGKLDSWSWITTWSSIAPPVHDQFVAMDRLADLGKRLVAAPYQENGNGRFSNIGSLENLCESADRLSDFDGNLLDQLEKNRRQMLATVSVATGGACQPV